MVLLVLGLYTVIVGYFFINVIFIRIYVLILNSRRAKGSFLTCIYCLILVSVLLSIITLDFSGSRFKRVVAKNDQSMMYV